MTNLAYPLSLNKSLRVSTYNCYGFAARTFHWEELEDYDNGQTNILDMLFDCGKNILENNSNLVAIADPDDEPPEVDVIGFRIAHEYRLKEYLDPEGKIWKVAPNEYELCVEDFHFITRISGEWYHKPGSFKICKVDFPIDEPWPHFVVPYNSPILWFKREQ